MLAKQRETYGLRVGGNMFHPRAFTQLCILYDTLMLELFALISRQRK